jgi:hemerythrin-like domain-containing protein
MRTALSVIRKWPTARLMQRNTRHAPHSKNHLQPLPGAKERTMPTTVLVPPTRALRRQVPALPPMDSLQRTHHDLLLAVDELQQLLRDIEENGATPDRRAIVRSLIQFIDTHGREHHAEEERSVFPDLLASADVDLVQHVRRLQQDHGWLEQDWLEMRPHLDAIAHGIGGVDMDVLRQAAEVFAELYRDHIALEETVVYPEALRQRHAAAGH